MSRHPSEELERLRRLGEAPSPELLAAGRAELARHIRIVLALSVAAIAGWVLTRQLYLGVLAVGYLGAVGLNLPVLVWSARLEAAGFEAARVGSHTSA